MKAINLKKFKKKYRPTLPPTAQSSEYEGLAWNIVYHEEYIRNKADSYVWTIIKDLDRGVIAIPYKDIINGIGFFIATEARRVEGYEYVKL
jgi:hypothetical protein